MPAVAVPIALSLIQAGVGYANKKKTEKEAKELRENRPDYEIGEETTDQLKLAESELQQGLSARTQRAYTQQLDKNTSNSLATILKGGGDVNSVGELYGNENEGILRLTQLNESTRLNNINRLITAQRNKTEQTDKSFMYNEDQWWKNDVQANNNARQLADQQMWSGINGAATGAMNLWQNSYEQKQQDDYLNPKEPKVTDVGDQFKNNDFYQYGN